MRVKCDNCKRILFETTDKYDPNTSPNGSMVRFLGGYHIDWLMSSTTLAAEMACPECQAQLAPSGRLTVLPDEAPDEVPDMSGGLPENLTTPFTSDDNPTPKRKKRG